jgi:hypothetical protein
MRIFAQITKVDEENRMVFGRAVQETVDRTGEIFDYDTSKPYFEEWSKTVFEDSNGKSLGNIRSMHGKVAAGKVVKIDFNDAEKAIDIGAKVIDDNEWEKVLEGVHTGFSIGGGYVKKWDDPEIKVGSDAAVRYTANPSEISLVDRPCVPTAKFFDVQKADGSVVQKEFKSQLTDDVVEAKAKELAKADGLDDPEIMDSGTNEPAWKAFIEPAKDALLKMDDEEEEKTEKSEGGEEETDDDEKKGKKEEETEKVETPPEPAADPGTVVKSDPPAGDEPTEYFVEGTDEEVSKLAKMMHEGKIKMSDVIVLVEAGVKKRAFDAESQELTKMVGAGEMKKGLWLVSRVADVVAQIESLCCEINWEEEWENDSTSELPAQIHLVLRAAGQLLSTMVAEEMAEALGERVEGQEVVLPDYFERFESLGNLAKIGRRNNSADQSNIQSMHDLVVKLGATCGEKEAAAPVLDLTKLDTSEAGLAKMQEILGKAVTGQIEKLAGDLKKVTQELEVLKSQPAAPRGRLKAVTKGEDIAESLHQSGEEVQPVVKNGQVAEAASLIKAAHASGGTRIGYSPEAPGLNKF